MNGLKKDINKNTQNTFDLKNKQKELQNKIPKDKLFHYSNKDNDSTELKFIQHQMADEEIFLILTKDLLDYQKYISEKIRRKKNSIQCTINIIKNFVNKFGQDYEVHTYGSYAYGLSMPWSDVDLVLTNKNQISYNNNMNSEQENNENVYLESTDEPQSEVNSVCGTINTDSTIETVTGSNILLFLKNTLTNLQWVKDINFVENLKVKILRIKTEDFDIDISLDSEYHSGLKCVELIKGYLNEYKMLKPLTIALKAILQSANLHIPSRGGLSSYGLILMIVSYIQSCAKDNNSTNNNYLLGKIFHGFLNHYGILFDYTKYLIVTYPINENNSVNNEKDGLHKFSQDFIILDPLNKKNNIASPSYQFMNIKMAFMIAFMVTKEDCDCGCHYGKAMYENSINSTEHSYLKRMFNSVRRFQG